jgi:hypothetical protein
LNFLNPLLLAGLAAAALPVIIHLINRRRAVRRRFPALDFLIKSQRRLARSLKIRQWLLLALRIAALVLIPLAMARPFLMSDAGSAEAERLPAGVVFVVDDSSSMNYGDGAVWEAAVDKIQTRMDELRPWDKAALVYASKAPASASALSDDSLTALTDDIGEIRTALSEHRPTPRATDLTSALRTAAEILADADLPQKRIVLVTDRQKSGLNTDALPEGGFAAAIEVLDVRPENVRPNLAVTGASYSQRSGGKRPEFAIVGEVRNYGDADLKGVQVQLEIDGKVVGSGLLDIPAHKTATKEFVHRFDGRTGLHQGVVKIAPGADDHSVDNVYHLPIHLQEKVRVLLVNGDPRSVAYQDELYYFERALNPSRSSKSSILTEQIGVDGLASREKLEEFDVIALANVEKLPRLVVARIEAFVKAGGGLLMVAGSNVRPDTWNATFGELLPKPVRSVKVLARRDEPDAPLRVVRFGATDATHPVFKVFELPGGESLQRVPVYSYLLLEPSAAGDARILASYSDGGPALIERRIGEGRSVLLTTTVDRDWTDFPIRVPFLVVMRRLVHHLGKRAAGGSQSTHLIGQRVEFADIDAGDRAQLEVRDPEGRRILLTPSSAQPGAPSGFVPLQLGAYQVVSVPELGGDPKPMPALAFAVNAESEESDLTPLSGDELSVLLTGAPEGDSAGLAQRPTRRVGLWSMLLFLVTLILLGETILGTRRSVLMRLGRLLIGRSATPQA